MLSFNYWNRCGLVYMLFCSYTMQVCNISTMETKALSALPQYMIQNFKFPHTFYNFSMEFLIS
jgi:hypothetical protein